MYILTDEAFNSLVNGEFAQVIIAKKIRPSMSINELYNYQFDYDSYNGFRKFYRRHLEPIINNIRYVDNDSVQANLLQKLWGLGREKKQ
jgi:hypothetical protein